MSQIRKTHSSKLKARVAIESLKESKTISQISSEEGIHSNQIGIWKKQIIDRAYELFEDKRKKQNNSQNIKDSDLYEQIGRLKIELEWLKKKYIQAESK